jgi:lysophospholipase L1-like esterase
MKLFSRIVIKRIAYAFFLIAFTLIAAEIMLRIYNPFPSSVVGDKIVLTPNYIKVYRNNVLKGAMDSAIVYQRNSIGLRGEEPPVPFEDHLSIIAIGGSTTECMLISEGKTWENVLEKKLQTKFPGCWINNAGFSGHSTFGHLILLRDYIIALKPRICLFTVGVNDIARTDLRFHDTEFTMTNQKWVLALARKSRLANAVLSLYRNHLAKEKNVADNYGFKLIGNASMVLPDSVIEKAITRERSLLNGYAQRLQQLIQLCRSNKIEPVFITQPSLMGEGKDDITNVDLASYKLNDSTNGRLYWRKVELYNNETLKVAADSGLLTIDVANQLPKSSAYFYDAIHFNIAGCAAVADLIAQKLDPYLQEKYPAFKK